MCSVRQPPSSVKILRGCQRHTRELVRLWGSGTTTRADALMLEALLLSNKTDHPVASLAVATRLRTVFSTQEKYQKWQRRVFLRWRQRCARAAPT